MWIHRTIAKQILNSSLSRPAVLVTGARQTGKSSLLKNIFNSTEYITFDHLKYVEQAKESPEHFFKQLKQQIILDEIQYVPEIFRELKIEIDKDRKNYGKWLLTGSQQFELMEGISESLAGRISIIHLESLSALELRGGNIRKINDHLWMGGYPELWSNEFARSYVQSQKNPDSTWEGKSGFGREY